MAASYGYDISNPATNAQEAIQWMYFAYLAAIKSQNGAAMSFGRTATFIDIYIERDLKAGKLTETEAQELVDHLVMNFVWFVSYVHLNTINYSLVTQCGQLKPSQVWV